MNILYADDKPIAAYPDIIPLSTITIPEIKPLSVMQTPGRNCRNCGAPLDQNSDCPYCGTRRQYKSEIIMDQHGISFRVG